MFDPKTLKIKRLSQKYPRIIKELEEVFSQPSNVYIDWANVILAFQPKLKWKIDIKKLKQFLDSFDTIENSKIYYGTLESDNESEKLIKRFDKLGYQVTTKPVKIMVSSIDATSIPPDSPALLKNFIRRPLLTKLDINTIEYLNNRLRELNEKNIFYLKDKKCNFDVEIGRDMLIDYKNNHIETFILWSGDSDFEEPIKQLLSDNKKVYIFATVRRVSRELSSTGAIIFDIQKIKEFICWNKFCSQKDSTEEPLSFKI